MAGCYTGPDADHFVAIVEELDVPADWQLAKSVVRGPDEDDPCDPFFTITCPGAVRSFLVDGDPADAYAQAKEVVTAAGFVITEEFREDCSGASCSFFSSRAGDQLSVWVYHSGAAANLGDDLRGPAVLISAHRD